MHIYWLPLAVLFVVLAALDVATYCKLKKSFRWPNGFHKLFAWLQVIPWSLAVAVACIPASTCSNSLLVVKMWLMWAFFLCTVPKVLFFLIYALTWIKGMGAKWQAFTRSVATLAATVSAALMIWGAVVTARSPLVTALEVASPRVPRAFDGYRIVHISDLHVATYGADTTFVAELVSVVNAEKPDLIVFTGDLVNRCSSEARPFLHTLSRLKAPDGVIAVDGNHDEPSRYHAWPSPADAAADSLALISMERQLGWQYLADEHTILRRGADSIVVLGLNYMDVLTVHPERMLAKARAGLNHDGHYTIVLEHSPALWRSLLSRQPGLDLTLAGHTHAMQAVVHLGKWRWSPAALFTPEWGGYYQSDDGRQALYVNVGTGTVGVPMRIGVRPEVTIITLKHQ